MTRRIALFLLLAAAIVPGRARADGEPSPYAPVPPGIETLVGSPADESLAAAALARAEGAGAGLEALRESRALLVLLDDVGLKHAATRLARGAVPPALLRHLLVVVGASEHPDADVLLERAAADAEPDVRALAADGLGRGRTPRAVPVLARLAQDASAAVRAAALRALFAIEGPEASGARVRLREDPRADLRAERLRLHRLRGDRGADLVALALRAWARDRSAAVRTQAAHVLAALEDVPAATLRAVLRENGVSPLVAALVRVANGFPAAGYDAVEERRLAIEAALALLVRAPEPERVDLVDRAVGWVARPVAMDPRGTDEPPEILLRERLPDLGAAIVEPVLRRLRANVFSDPEVGTRLLRSLGAEEGLPALRELLAGPGGPARVAAASAVGSFGIGDEALARRLLDPKETRSFRHDVVVALSAEPEPWASTVLGEELARPKSDLVDAVLDALERRTDDAATRLLADVVFLRPGVARYRMARLVTAGDDVAYALLERALADPRFEVRDAALAQLVEARSLRGDRARSLALAYRVRAEAPGIRSQETQRLLSALLVQAPEAAVAYVRERWEELGALDYQDVALTKLNEVRGPAAERAAVDLLLEKLGTSPSALRLGKTIFALGPHGGHRDTEVDDVFRLGLAHADENVSDGVAQAVAYGAARGDLTEPLLALLDAPPGEEVPWERSAHVLAALRRQPFTERVEARALALALEATAPVEARIAAAELLAGRMGDASRRRLMAWLADTAFGRGEPDVEHALAGAAGDGGGPVVAATFAGMIEEEVRSRFQSEESLDPEAEHLDDRSHRVDALARAIARTGDAPAMERVVALVLDPRFARYAQAAVRVQARRLARAGAVDRLRPPPSLAELGLVGAGALDARPPEVAALVDGMKWMEDEPLASSLEAAFAAARAGGGLARFPDVVLERLHTVLLDARSGWRRRAADVVAHAIRRVEPVDGAADLAVASQVALRRAEERRFEEALAAQTEVVRILARRGHDATEPQRYVRERAALDALRGADLASRGRTAEAEAAFAEALVRAPLDVEVLKGIARRRLLASADLATAEALARRAVALEQRLDERERVDTADALAAVWLAEDRAAEAAALLEIHGDPKTRAPYLLRYAEALARSGRPAEAAEPIRNALQESPGLHAWLRAQPWMAPLLGDPDVARSLADAASRLRRME